MRVILATLFLCTAFAPAWAEPSAETVARGKALTEAGGCASCHTADAAKPFAGGKKIDTPFGGIYSPNLTPDRDTGLGAWSDDEFYRALHEGIGRALLLKSLRGFQESGLNHVSLEVTAANEAALRLYVSLGFRLTKTLFREVDR